MASSLMNWRRAKRKRLCVTLSGVALILSLAGSAQSQQAGEVLESDITLLLAAESDIQRLSSETFSRKTDIARRAERRLEEILRRDANSPFKARIIEDLRSVHELLAEQHLQVALFYLDKAQRGGGLKGANSRLLEITRKYVSFSKMDEVLFSLARVAVLEKSPAEASHNLWKLVCKYPASRFSAAAFAELYQLGTNDWKGCEEQKP